MKKNFFLNFEPLKLQRFEEKILARLVGEVQSLLEEYQDVQGKMMDKRQQQQKRYEKNIFI